MSFPERGECVWEGGRRRGEEGRVSFPERGECVREGGREEEGGGRKGKWAREGG